MEETSFIGLGLLVLSLLFDALTNGLQEKMKASKLNPSSNSTRISTSLVSVAVCLATDPKTDALLTLYLEGLEIFFV